MRGYIRLRDFFVWSCDISHLLLFVYMMLHHRHTIWRVRSRISFRWGFCVLYPFLGGILCCIAALHLVSSWYRVTSLSSKEALAHWVLYFTSVSCGRFHFIWLYHRCVHGCIVIWASSSCESLWLIFLSLELLLAILDAILLYFLWNDRWLLEMLGCVRYNDVCGGRMLVTCNVISILHYIWKGR
jgi:hypothetical protein